VTAGERYWVGVASRDHVLRAVEGGFVQLSHGKRAPLERMGVGDWLVYYSPKESRKGGGALRAFTAIGRVVGEEAYSFDLGGGFVPFRRNVRYLPAEEAPIRPLIDRLSFIRNKGRWGQPFRRGHLEIPQVDFELVASAMGLNPGTGFEDRSEDEVVDEGLGTRYAEATDSPGLLLWQVTNMWQRRQRATLKAVNLTHVQFVLLASLAWLSRDGGPVAQARVAEHAKTDPVMTSEVLRTLQRKGLVERRPHPEDTRAKSLKLTPEGTRIVRRAVGLVERTDLEFFAPLDGDAEALTRLLRRLTGAP